MRSLLGRNVTIIPDADDPGIAHAKHVALNLINHGNIEPRIAQLDGAKDVSDWLDQGHDPAELEALTIPLADWPPWAEAQPATAAAGGPQASASATAARGATGTTAGQRTAAQIIDAWIDRRYDPIFKRGNAAWAAAQSRLILPRDILADDQIIEELKAASNAPVNKQGAVSVNALPAFFITWSRPAFGAKLLQLPTEADCERNDAAPAFRRNVGGILTALITTARISRDVEKTLQTPERRSVGAWCAKMTFGSERWCRLRSYDCWAIRTPEGLNIAIRPALARQVEARTPEIAELSLDELALTCAEIRRRRGRRSHVRLPRSRRRDPQRRFRRHPRLRP